MRHLTKLSAAEALQQKLLDEMNTIDQELAGLQPADPRRPELKAKKAEILPRYRGAKQHVKNLRRLINSAPQPEVADEALCEEEEDLLEALYSTLTGILDDEKNGRKILLDLNDVERIHRFVEWWEEEDGNEP